MPFAFHVFTPMEKHVLEVIDNETNEELPKGLSENSTYNLRKTEVNYFIL